MNSEHGIIRDVRLRGASSFWIDRHGRAHFRVDGCPHGEPACLRCRIRQARHLRRIGNGWRLSLSAMRKAKR